MHCTIVISFILTRLSYTSELPLVQVNSAYDNAVKYSTQALYKQSGLEADVNRVKDITYSNVNTYLMQNNLQFVSTLILMSTPILLNKKIELHNRNYIINLSNDTKEFDIIIGF